MNHHCLPGSESSDPLNSRSNQDANTAKNQHCKTLKQETNAFAKYAFGANFNTFRFRTIFVGEYTRVYWLPHLATKPLLVASRCWWITSALWNIQWRYWVLCGNIAHLSFWKIQLSINQPHVSAANNCRVSIWKKSMHQPHVCCEALPRFYLKSIAFFTVHHDKNTWKEWGERSRLWGKHLIKF